MIAYSSGSLQETQREIRNRIPCHRKSSHSLAKASSDKIRTKRQSYNHKPGASHTSICTTSIAPAPFYFTTSSLSSLLYPQATSLTHIIDRTTVHQRYCQAFDRNGFLPSQSGHKQKPLRHFTLPLTASKLRHSFLVLIPRQWPRLSFDATPHVLDVLALELPRLWTVRRWH